MAPNGHQIPPQQQRMMAPPQSTAQSMSQNAFQNAAYIPQVSNFIKHSD